MNVDCKMKRIIVWFRNDLRLSDNEALHQACLDADEIIPYYCFEESAIHNESWPFPKTGAFRAQFILESVAALQAQLREEGLELQIYHGSSLKGLLKIKEEYQACDVYCAEEVSQEELDREKEMEENGFIFKRFWQNSLYAKTDLPMEIQQLPRVFTAFRKKMEKYAQVPKALPKPALLKGPEKLMACELPSHITLGLATLSFDSRSAFPFKGGGQAARARMQSYFWEETRILEYKNTRNGLIGDSYSSKFSPWLALGCISAREIYWELKKFEEEVKSNSSTYWMYFELLWRDFFRFTALKEGRSFFKMKEGQAMKTLPHFEAWRQGETGQAFVDANMKELLHTGFMSNRGRQNVASYLIHDLKIPWHLGAAWFESQLIDYDVCSNYGNWTYLAGLGNDPRPDRYFNVQSQAERYDADGAYQRLWLT